MQKKKTRRGSQKKLHTPRELSNVVNVKEVIRQRMKQLGWKPYRLAQLVKGQVTPQAVYKFINGKGEMGSGNLALLFAALGIELTFSKQPPPPGAQQQE